jgi:hypothetical protein
MSNTNSSTSIPYCYRVSEAALNDPETIESVRMTLPCGLSAPFGRLSQWTPVTTEEEG